MRHAANDAMLYRRSTVLLDLKGIVLVVLHSVVAAVWGKLDGDIAKVGLLGTLIEEHCGLSFLLQNHIFCHITWDREHSKESELS